MIFDDGCFDRLHSRDESYAPRGDNTNTTRHSNGNRVGCTNTVRCRHERYAPRGDITNTTWHSNSSRVCCSGMVRRRDESYALRSDNNSTTRHSNSSRVVALAWSAAEIKVTLREAMRPARALEQQRLQSSHGVLKTRGGNG